MGLLAAGMVLVLAPAPSLSPAPGSGCPPSIEAEAVQQLAGLLAGPAPGRPADDPQVLERARRAVRARCRRLQALGEAGVVKSAPDLDRLELKASGDPRLNAIARYMFCGGVLTRKHLDPARQKDPAAGPATAEGISAVAMAVIYLHSFLPEGTEASIQAFVTSEEMERAFGRVQDRPELFEYTDGQCRPAVGALLQE